VRDMLLNEFDGTSSSPQKATASRARINKLSFINKLFKLTNNPHLIYAFRIKSTKSIFLVHPMQGANL
jgi:hypothetical protein